MPSLAFSIGKEAALDFVHPDFGVINFGLLTSFEAAPRTNTLTSVPITNGGESVHRVLHHGWEGTVEIDRADDILDAVLALLEDRYYAGAPESYWMITQTITNPDGTVNQYRFKNVVLIPGSPGTWAGETKVTGRFTFIATRRESV